LPHATDYAYLPMFGYRKADVVPTSVFAPSSDFGADGDGQADEQPLIARVRRAAGELALMVRAGLGEGAVPTGGEETAGEAQEPSDDGGAGLDPQVSDFVPMDALLRRSVPAPLPPSAFPPSLRLRRGRTRPGAAGSAAPRRGRAGRRRW